MAPEGIIPLRRPGELYTEARRLPDAAVIDLGVPVLGHLLTGWAVLTMLAGGRVARRDAPRIRPRAHRGGGHERSLHRTRHRSRRPRGVDEATAIASESLPAGFEVLASSRQLADRRLSATARAALSGLQFHPEVRAYGSRHCDLRNFLFRVCRAEPTWTMENFIGREVERIRAEVDGGRRALCALRRRRLGGGLRAIVDRAVGDRLTCVSSTTACCAPTRRRASPRSSAPRFGERCASSMPRQFLDALAGVEESEDKRRAIGRTFIEVFEAERVRFPASVGSPRGHSIPT